MILRAAEASDLEAIKALHIDSWQRSYVGLLPQAYLAGPVVADLSALWGPEALDGRACAVAEEGGLLGFAVMAKLGQGTPYLDSLHVAKEAQGQGVGRTLLSWIANALRGQGYDALCLDVLAGNAAGLAAYQALGGQLGTPVQGTCFGHEVTDIPVRWDSLEGFLEK